VNARLKFNSRMVSDRVGKLFDDMSLIVNASKYANQAVVDVYTKFQEFFTTFGRPTFKLRRCQQGMPPWADDLNAMVNESVNDINTIYGELGVLADSAQAVHTLAAAEILAMDQYLAGTDKLLDDFRIYTENVTEDLYVGDTFDDNSLISETNCTLNPSSGLLSLKVEQTINYAPRANIKIHGGSENSFPGNLLQIVPAPIEEFLPEAVHAEDARQNIGKQTSSGTPIIMRNDGQLSADIRGENKYPQAMVDGDPSSIFEYEMFVVPNHVWVTADPGKDPFRSVLGRLGGDLIPTMLQQARDAAGDQMIGRRHPMKTWAESKTAADFLPILPGHSANPSMLIAADGGFSYTMGYDWAYKINDEREVKKVRFVEDMNWQPNDNTVMETNIEFEFRQPVNITALTIDPAILQDLSTDYQGADHFTLVDIGFNTTPILDNTGIPVVLWGSDLGIELPVDITDTKTITFEQQRVHSVILYFKSEQPYKCKVSHPYVERDYLIEMHMEKKSGGFSFWRVKHDAQFIWFGDRYPIGNPAIGDIIPFIGPGVRTGSSLAKSRGLAISDEVGALIFGAYAGAGNLGGDLADVAVKAGYGSGSGTVGNVLESQLHPFDDLGGAIPSQMGDIIITPKDVMTRGNTTGGYFTPEQEAALKQQQQQYNSGAGQDASLPTTWGGANAPTAAIYTQPDITGQTESRSADNPNAYYGAAPVKWAFVPYAALRNTKGLTIPTGADFKEEWVNSAANGFESKDGWAGYFLNNTHNGTMSEALYNRDTAMNQMSMDGYLPRMELYTDGSMVGDHYVVQWKITGDYANSPTLRDMEQEAGRGLQDAMQKPLSKLRERVMTGMADKIMKIGGHIVAEVINNIIGGILSLFAKCEWRLTYAGGPVDGSTPETIYYGLEAFDAYRYWIALKEVKLESNYYATNGYMISMWYDVPEGIARLSVLSEEDVPDMFKNLISMPVAYSVQFEEGEEWYQMEPVSGSGLLGLPRYIEVNPSIQINNPAFREITRKDADGNLLPATKVRVKIELARPADKPEYSPQLLSYKLGIKTAS